MKTDNIKDFIHQNQDEFDEWEPSKELLQRIEKSKPHHQRASPIRIKMNPLRWMSAAAACILLFVGLQFIFTHTARQTGHTSGMLSHNENPDTHYYRGPMERQIIPVQKDSDTDNNLPDTVERLVLPEKKEKKLQNRNSAIELEKEALYHYIKLIEVKQQQITVLKADEPLLFEQFSVDFEALEKSFAQLKSMQGNSINKEQILQAMISNLEMQTELLNKQLQIIQNIEQKKQEHYETNYQRDI